MTRTIVLDSGPLGMICHPNPRGEARHCQSWLQSMAARGNRIVIPEISDHEVRRELIRAKRRKAISILNDLCVRHLFFALDTPQMILAAELWAQVRNLGLPTAGPDSLDAAAILAAQALSLNGPAVVVATSNPGHLSRFVNAEPWQNFPTH